MDALCLFDADTRRIVGVNVHFSRLFGYGPIDARTMTIADLAVTPAEILSAVPSRESLSNEIHARGHWRRADGSQFVADFSMCIHYASGTPVMFLLVHASAAAPNLSVVEDEILSETGVPAQLKSAMRDRLARCTRQQSALLKLASEEESDFETLMRKILRVDAETLGVARVSYWTLGKEGTSIICEALYDVRDGKFQVGLELFAKDYPGYFRSLVTGALIPAHDAITDARTMEFAEPYLKPLGIGAMLDIPVFCLGDLAGVVCHEHVGGARGWTMDEQQFAMSIGQMFSLALSSRQREDARRTIKRHETMLQEANAVLERALRPNDGQLTGRRIGKYAMEQMVGRGGAGEVYRAKRLEDGAMVAIKVLRKASLAKPEQVQRFFREARLTASVPSDHVARVYETGFFDSDLPFIAMELLEGHDLAWHLRRASQLPLEQVVDLCEHASKALAAVRDAGVVHRDLKPSNLFLVDSIPRAWKVLDFGLSRSDVDPYKTVAEEIAGTPHYMAPEQICGDPTDHRTDLYALAAIAYRALTGRPPFVGDLQTVLMAALTEPLPPITSFLRDVPVEIDLVIAMGLAKSPESRFANVETFAEALRGASKGELSDEFRAAGWKLLKVRK